MDRVRIHYPAAETGGEGALTVAGIEGLSYNLCNNLLHDYYNGEYVGYRRSMVIDGFLNGDGFAQLSPGAWIKDGRLWFCRQTAVLPLEMNFGSEAPYSLSSQRDLTRSWMNEGHGEIDGGSIYVRNSYDEFYIGISLSCAGVTRSGSMVLSSSSAKRLVTFTLDHPLRILPGQTVTMTVRSGEAAVYSITLYGARAEDGFGCKLSGRGTAVNTGVCVAKPQKLEDDCGAALAWVRYEGTPPAVGLQNAAGVKVWLSMAGTRAAQTLDGKDCMEAKYRLKGGTLSTISDPVNVLLDMDNPGIVSVYEYGVTFQ